MRQKGELKLSTGEVFEGNLIGAPVDSSGELVFTTGMVGYSEAITDPSYFGQILVFTYPLIGNYGIPNMTNSVPVGFESNRVQAAGVILSTPCTDPYHWNSAQNIDVWLKNQGVPCLTNIDTRHLVHLLRQSRRLGRIVSPGIDNEEFFDPHETNLLPSVSTSEIRHFGKGKIVVGLIDCGTKWNIIRQLIELDCRVMLLPWNTNFENINCDAWVISNGPGDPAKTEDLKLRIEKLFHRPQPILGVCMGHQIVALASGAKTKQMPFGHRSQNQPVYEVVSKKGYITTQNHGYVVDEKTLSDEWTPWFVNANDGTLEGIKHKTKSIFAVQFHPEASGGPHDTNWIMNDFIALAEKLKHAIN